MYNSRRIIIDTRKYDVDEVFERYKAGKIIFYEKNNVSRKRKNKVTREVLEALSRGIPFPPVYVSELQTGELLVLDKSDRLRFLMEYLDDGYAINNSTEYARFNERNYLPEKLFEDSELIKDIFYSPIMLHVIDYMNPKYMHMQVGAFIEGWSVTQEQSIRNILYQGTKMGVLEELLSEISYPIKLKLNIQYNLLYFIMVNMVAERHFDNYDECYKADKFQLLENTIYELNYMNYGFLRDLCMQFERLYKLISQKDNPIIMCLHITKKNKTKYLCFISIFMRIRNVNNILGVLEDKKIRHMIENCDMSYRSINRIIEYFRKENL